MKFNSLSALESYLKNAIDVALENQVADAVAEEVAVSAQKVVYDVYSPKVYERRMSLLDETNIENQVGNNTLTATMRHTLNPWSGPHSPVLAPLLEHGYGDMSKPYNKPRPFVQTTIDSLSSNKKHVEALREGLQSQGIDAK